MKLFSCSVVLSERSSQKMDNSDGKIDKPFLKIAFHFPLRSALADHSLFVIRHS